MLNVSWSWQSVTTLVLHHRK